MTLLRLIRYISQKPKMSTLHRNFSGLSGIAGMFPTSTGKPREFSIGTRVSFQICNKILAMF